MILKLKKLLLPKGPAFRISTQTKNHRTFWGWIASVFEEYKTYIDTRYLSTQSDPEWGNVFGGVVDWKDDGSVTPAYIQAKLIERGFTDAVVREWFYVDGGFNPVPSRCEYLLSNKITYSTVTPEVAFGTADVQFNGSTAQMGGAGITTVGLEPTPVPSVKYWPWFMYVSATIPAERKDEFDALILKLRPLHLWIGINPNIIP